MSDVEITLGEFLQSRPHITRIELTGRRSLDEPRAIRDWTSSTVPMTARGFLEQVFGRMPQDWFGIGSNQSWQALSNKPIQGVDGLRYEQFKVVTLPADPDGQNDARADWAQSALDALQASTGCEELDALPDLLTDLMHWCDRHDRSFDAALEDARDAYDEETYYDDEEK